MILLRLFLMMAFLHVFGSKSMSQIKLDSIPTVHDSIETSHQEVTHLQLKKFIIPTVFLSYGIASLENPHLRILNSSTRAEVLEDKPLRLHLDNYTQYVPAAMVYGLNMVGIKGKHNFKDRTVIYLTSQVISAGIVVPLKRLVREERPDKSDNYSFPSGHTSTAFSSAQFLFEEYKDTNLWLSLSGYPFAAFTGIYRIINNKHWVGDVMAGAGFGILSTEIAYWLHPKMCKLFGSSEHASIMLTPTYQNNTLGIGLVTAL